MAGRRPPTSGYTRTDVIGNYDMHPDEGYEFKRRDKPKITNSQKTSAMFPLNRKVNDKAVPERVVGGPPTQFVDPVTPQVRSFRSKKIFDSMVATRAMQTQYADEKRQYDIDVKAADEVTEMKQVELARAKADRERLKKNRRVEELRTTYQQQLADVAKRRQRERQEELDYEMDLRRQDAIRDRQEEQKQAKIRAINEESKRDAQRRNDELLMRKGARQEQELDEEKKIQRENAEIQARRDARGAEDARRRMVKTNMRSRVVEERAKAMLAQSKKDDDQQQMAESAAAKQKMSEIMTLRMKHEQLESDRHSEWIKLQKERDARKRPGAKQPFPLQKKEIDAEAFAQQQRKQGDIRYKEYLRRQASQNQAREKREMQDDIDMDNQMLAATQAKFDQSLNKLQGLIPAELGITVPKYTMSRSITKFN